MDALVLNAVGAELGGGIDYALGLIAAVACWFCWLGWSVDSFVAPVVITSILVIGLTSLDERQGLVNND